METPTIVPRDPPNNRAARRRAAKAEQKRIDAEEVAKRRRVTR